ncbi:MAG: hypothetical protein AMXMBFR34_42730 [Myxococcaceae bacterium]
MNPHALLLLALLASAGQAADRPSRVIFTDTTARDDRSKDAAAIVSSQVARELARSGREVVTTRDLSASGQSPASPGACPSSECQRAAAAVRADFVLVASVSKLGRRFGIELRLVDPAAGKILAERAEVATTEKELASAVQTAFAALFEDVPVRLADALKSAPPPDVPTERPVPLAAPEPPPQLSTSSPSRLPGLLTAGAGAAVSVVGLVLVTTSLSFNQAKRELTFDEAQAARSGAQTQLIIGYSLIGAGLAGVGLGLWWALSPPKVQAAVVPLPGGAALSFAGSF